MVPSNVSKFTPEDLNYSGVIVFMSLVKGSENTKMFWSRDLVHND